MAQQNALYIMYTTNIYVRVITKIAKVVTIENDEIEAINLDGTTVNISSKDENFIRFCNSKGERYFAFGGEE